MSYKQYYKNLIWTNHAIERMRNRGLSQDVAWQAFKNHDQNFEGKTKGAIEYQKRFDTFLVTVVAKRNEKNEWIIISAWIDPPFPGSADAKQKTTYHQYQKAGFWGKLWLTLKKQLTG